ncbi:MAG: hypothetical protein WBP18_15640 [Paracoccaceae bacterium]
MYCLTLSSDPRIFILQFRDRMTVSEARQGFVDIVAHPEFDPAIPIFAVLRGVTELVADFPGIFGAVQAVRKQIKRFGPGSKCVILAGNEVHYGVARMLEQIVDAMSQLRIRVVARADEAAKALGLTVEALEALMQAAERALPEGPPDA